MTIIRATQCPQTKTGGTATLASSGWVLASDTTSSSMRPAVQKDAKVSTKREVDIRQLRHEALTHYETTGRSRREVSRRGFYWCGVATECCQR